MTPTQMLTGSHSLPNAVFLLGAGALLLMAFIAMKRNVVRDAIVTLLVSIAAAFSMTMAPLLPHLGGQDLFQPDSWSVYTSLLIIFCGIGVVLMAPAEVSGGDASTGSEFYLLLLLTTFGAVVMTSAASILTFFLGLETLSLALIGLIAFNNRSDRAGEASMKYLILSGVASAIMMFGFALIYSETGSLRFHFPHFETLESPVVTYVGVILLLTGLFFKLSAVPFHLWLADVLEGASNPVAVIVAITSKIALFAAMMRYFSSVDLFSPGIVYDEVAIVAILSMLGGNLLAVVQKDFRRLMAGSSIAHIGYLLVAFLSPVPYGFPSAALYLTAYTVSTLTVFAVMAGVMPHANDLRQWHGLFRKKPFAALMIAVALISLAGIPPMVGFFGKFYISAAGLAAHRYWLLAALIISSIIGLFYYLRVIFIMATPARATDFQPVDPTRPTPFNIALIAILAFLTLSLGALPNNLLLRSQSVTIDPPSQQNPEVSPHAAS